MLYRVNALLGNNTVGPNFGGLQGNRFSRVCTHSVPRAYTLADAFWLLGRIWRVHAWWIKLNVQPLALSLFGVYVHLVMCGWGFLASQVPHNTH